MKEKLRYFGFSGTVTLAALIGTLFGMGWSAALVMAVLIIVEVTFSFENAVINAKVLRTMSKAWQTAFLTIGIVIAIFGMRIVFPILIVVLTAGLGWREVIDLALNHSAEYAERLHEAHTTIAAFGGAFLLMLFLHFFFDRDKKEHWIEAIERPLSRLGHRFGNHWLPALLSVLAVLVIAALSGNDHSTDVLKAGLIGIATYVAIRGIEHLFARFNKQPLENEADTTKASKKGGMVVRTGWAAFATFIYLEILDASFSFDGVIGAFAITKSVVLIALGLGVGAVWVRSLTVYMVRKGTLEKYLYLEHGAHYTVGVLALTLLASVVVAVPEVVAGLAGIAFVGSAFWSSRRHARRVGTLSK